MRRNLLLIAVILASALAFGQTIQINPGDITNPSVTIDFNSLANGTAITNQYSPVTFTNAFADTSDAGIMSNNGGVVASNFVGSCPNGGNSCTPITINFGAGAYQVGLFIVTNAGTTIAGTTSGGGNFNFTFNTNLNGGSFIGFQDASGITSLTLDASGTVNGAMLIDNVEVVNTPEPASLLLLGTGLLSGAGTLRRRFIR